MNNKKAHKGRINNLRFKEPIYSFLDRRWRKQYDRPNLSTEQERIIAEVKDKGFALSHVSHFGIVLPPVSLGGVPQTGKNYIHTLKDPQGFFWNLAHHPAITATVSAYLETIPVPLVLLLEKVIVAKEQPHHSQLWHRDSQDKRMLNMFIYINDVDETTGPFTYVQYSKTKYKDIHPQQFSGGGYLTDDILRKHVPASDIKPLTGKAGTIIFADVTGLHCGGYATKRERVMFSASYTTHVSLWPRKNNL